MAGKPSPFGALGRSEHFLTEERGHDVEAGQQDPGGAEADAEQRRDGAFGGVFHQDRGGARSTVGERQQRLAVGPLQHRADVDAGERAERGSDVHGADGCVDPAGR